MVYTGEKRPNMWWTEFERRLNLAISTINKVEKRVVYSEPQLLRLLLKKVRCDWLTGVKDIISIELSKYTTNCTYGEAMIAFKNSVMKKYPAHSNTQNTSRRVKSTTTTTNRNQPNKGNSNRRNSKGNSKSTPKRKTPHPDERTITLTNGKQIQYHASYWYTQNMLDLFSAKQLENRRQERASYRDRNRSNSNQRSVKELQRQVDDMRSTISAYTGVPTHVQMDRGVSAVSQVTSRRSIMGGRNEQERRRRDDRSRSRRDSRSRSRSRSRS